jgi:hypothetical protein
VLACFGASFHRLILAIEGAPAIIQSTEADRSELRHAATRAMRITETGSMYLITGGMESLRPPQAIPTHRLTRR